MYSRFFRICFFLNLIFESCESLHQTLYIAKSENLTLNCSDQSDVIEYCYWSHGGDSIEYTPIHGEIQNSMFNSNGHWPILTLQTGCDITLLQVSLQKHHGLWTCVSVGHGGVQSEKTDFLVFVMEPPILEIIAADTVSFLCHDDWAARHLTPGHLTPDI